MDIIPKLIVHFFLALSGLLIATLAGGLMLYSGYEPGRLLMVIAGILLFILSARLEL